MSLTEVGAFETANASRYMQQLCKHFEHKITVEYDETSARAELPPGESRMQASPQELVITITAEDAEGLKSARAIVDDHLKRFAFRENFEGMTWRAA